MSKKAVAGIAAGLGAAVIGGLTGGIGLAAIGATPGLIGAGILGAGATAGLSAGQAASGGSADPSKGFRRAFTLPKFPEQPGGAYTASAPTDPDAAKRAMDAADQERRRKLVADPNITGSLGLSESASVRRSVLG